MLMVTFLGVSTPVFAYGGCNSCRVYQNNFYDNGSNYGDYYNGGYSGYGYGYGGYDSRSSYRDYYNGGYGGGYYNGSYGSYYGNYSSGSTRKIVTGMAVGAVLCYFWCN